MDGVVLSLPDIPWCLLRCIHGQHSMAQGTHKMGTALSHAQPSTALRFSGGLLAWSSLETSDRAQETAGDVSGKGLGVH